MILSLDQGCLDLNVSFETYADRIYRYLISRCANGSIAAGVPLTIDEPEGFSTFRLGLFGLDKLGRIDRTVTTLDSPTTPSPASGEA